MLAGPAGWSSFPTNAVECWAIAPGDVLVALGTPVSLGEFAEHA